jgi:SAM-dependent methyltransferase
MQADVDTRAQPADAYFDVMASAAEAHWWYRGRRALVRQLLAGRLDGRGHAIDVGCGTGETLEVLESLGAGAAVGTDLSPQALGYARGRHPRVLRALAEALPFRTGSADCLVSMDVVEHLDDDVVGLREYVRVLAPGSPVLVTAPAYRWLWSEHDEIAAHRRRYDPTTLRRAATDAGIVVERVTYFYTFLVPPAALLRRTPLRRLVRATDDEASGANPIVDAVFSALSWLERLLLRRFDLPFGLSIALVGRVPEAEA